MKLFKIWMKSLLTIYIYIYIYIYILTETGEVDESEYEYYQPSVQSNEQRGLRANPEDDSCWELEEMFVAEVEADACY